jgi:molybdate transport system substrate-binding protein
MPTSAVNNRTSQATFVALLLITFSLLFLPSRSFAASLHLAVASNFISPIKQLAQDFEQETGQSLTLSFGSSGKLFAQIQNSAPYDIFLSADVAKPQALVQSNNALPDSLVIYAKGHLVFWSVNPISSTSLKDAVLNAKRIAIANPKLAPYGKAAEESLTSLSVWNDAKKKMVQGENIGQTYQFVYSQNADAGFVALSQVLAGKTKGHVIDIPSDAYQQINQAGVILSQSQNIELAQTFMAFLMRPDIQAKIVQFGYAAEQH